MNLSVEGLSFAYDGKDILIDIGFELGGGEVLGIIGPNGAGKTTLVRCLHSALHPRKGKVLLDSRDIREMSRREIALRIGVVPQRCDPGFAFSVFEFVRMGRYPRQGRWTGDSAADIEAVNNAMEATGVAPLAGRRIDEMSGGEFQKALVAQAIAQEPNLLLLDEPLQQLDIRYQLEIMNIVRSRVGKTGLSVVAVLHDLNMAARFADRLLLMDHGKIYAQGSVVDVLTERNIREVFGIEADVRCPDESGVPHVIAVRPVGKELLKEEKDHG